MNIGFHIQLDQYSYRGSYYWNVIVLEQEEVSPTHLEESRGQVDPLGFFFMELRVLPNEIRNFVKIGERSWDAIGNL